MKYSFELLSYTEIYLVLEKQGALSAGDIAAQFDKAVKMSKVGNMIETAKIAEGVSHLPGTNIGTFSLEDFIALMMVCSE